MFRIKRDDYNTVQFLPDYKSSRRSRKAMKNPKAASPGKSRKSEITKKENRRVSSQTSSKRKPLIFIIILILLIAIAVGGWYVYSQYFSQKAKFIEAFSSGNYTLSEQIAEDNQKDAFFKKGIRSTVRGRVDDIMDQYMSSELIATDTLDALDECDKASAELFDKYVQKQKVWLDTVETIYYLADLAGTQAKNKEYDDAMNNLYEVERLAKENNLILDSKIIEVLNNNMDGLKATLFVEFSNTIRYESDYSSITDACSFVTRYVPDEDFTDYLSTVEEVKDGSCTKLEAAREARTIAKASGASIEVNGGSGRASNTESSDEDD